MYTIGKFSKMTGISVVALRYYDERGVIRPEVKKDNGYRYYTERQLLQAQFINNMKEFGMPLEEIAKVMAAKDPSYTLQKITEMKFKLQEQMNRLSQIELYFAKGIMGRNEAVISRDNVEKGILEGCRYIAKEIDELSLRQVFTFDCLELQTMRGQIDCYQKSGMLILNRSYRKNGKDLLIMPLLVTDQEVMENTSGVQIQAMPGYETLNTTISKSTLDVSEEICKLEEVAAEMGIETKGDPIIECLLDPGDVPDMNQYIARLHLIIE